MSEGRPARAARFTPRTRPVVPPIHQSVTYFLDDESYKDVQAGGLDEIWYGRFRNPTVDVAADEVARLEDAESAFMTSSGMGAIATSLLSLLRAGDRLVAARQVYGDTRDLLVVDNTSATPYGVQPLTHGADLVVHSATKFLGGHSDVIAGAVVESFELVREVQRRVVTLGTCLDPHAAFLVWRGLQTFELRPARSSATARVLAAALDVRDDDGMLRVSCGVEPEEAVVGDFLRALDEVS